MPRPLPVNLLMAGTGAVLLVSGIGGESIGEVLKGSFGDVTGKQQARQAALGTGEGVAANVANAEGGEGVPPAPTSFSGATFAPSPTEFSNKRPTQQQQAKGIARILLSWGITHPTPHDIERARLQYEKETGIPQVIHLKIPQIPTVGGF